jgi:hypothetical protein
LTDWGSVADWVSGIGTAGSLLLGFAILLRDRLLSAKAEPSKVICWSERLSAEDDYNVTVLNGSNAIIFDVTIHVLLSPIIRFGLQGRMLPDETATCRIAKSVDQMTPTVRFYPGAAGARPSITYMTADGKTWCRPLGTGTPRQLSSKQIDLMFKDESPS